MSKTKITKRFLDSVSPGGKDVFYRDTELPGFGIKVSTQGTISFIAEGRIRKGKTKRVTLGKHPILPLDLARTKAQEALLAMRDGFDPVEIEEEARQKRNKAAATEEAKRVTLKTVFTDYLAIRGLKPKTTLDYRNTIHLCLPDWLSQPVPKISRRMVEDRFVKVRDERGKGQAAKCMRILSAVLNHAKAYEVEDGIRLITDNPCDVLKEKRVDRSLKPRETYLNREQLRLVMEELSHVGHPAYLSQPSRLTNRTVVDFLTLLIFTGLRREEAATLTWTNVMLGDRLFIVRDTKNGSDHIVPMVEQVERMLRRRHDAADKHDAWVFPNRLKTGPLKEPRKQIEKLREITGVQFSCHDLRRTFATLAESYGVDQSSIKRAMNHKTKDITERYIQTQADKMRQTFEAIAAEIMWWAFDEPKLSPKKQKKRDKEDKRSYERNISDRAY